MYYIYWWCAGSIFKCPDTRVIVLPFGRLLCSPSQKLLLVFHLHFLLKLHSVIPSDALQIPAAHYVPARLHHSTCTPLSSSKDFSVSLIAAAPRPSHSLAQNEPDNSAMQSFTRDLTDQGAASISGNAWSVELLFPHCTWDAGKGQAQRRV